MVYCFFPYAILHGTYVANCLAKLNSNEIEMTVDTNINKNIGKLNEIIEYVIRFIGELQKESFLIDHSKRIIIVNEQDWCQYIIKLNVWGTKIRLILNLKQEWCVFKITATDIYKDKYNIYYGVSNLDTYKNKNIKLN